MITFGVAIGGDLSTSGSERIVTMPKPLLRPIREECSIGVRPVCFLSVKFSNLFGEIADLLNNKRLRDETTTDRLFNHYRQD
jgi:hypothetical protein